MNYVVQKLLYIVIWLVSHGNLPLVWLNNIYAFAEVKIHFRLKKEEIYFNGIARNF